LTDLERTESGSLFFPSRRGIVHLPLILNRFVFKDTYCEGFLLLLMKASSQHPRRYNKSCHHIKPERVNVAVGSTC